MGTSFVYKSIKKWNSIKSIKRFPPHFRFLFFLLFVHLLLSDTSMTSTPQENKMSTLIYKE